MICSKYYALYVHAQLCLTLCDSIEYTLPGSICEIFQARILDGLSFSLPRDLPNPGIKPTPLPSPALAGKFFTTSTTWETLVNHVNPLYCIASVALGSPSILPVLVLPVCLDCKFFEDMKTHVY